MSTHVPEFQSFLMFLHHFVMAKLATISIRVELISKSLNITSFKGHRPFVRLNK